MENFKESGGENILLVAGSPRGIRIIVLGEKEQVVLMLKSATKSSFVMREILATLSKAKGGEGKEENHVVYEQR